jgi:hypothetical protein
MGSLSHLDARPMSDTVLQKIFDSDQDMYPAPLTNARLKSWVESSPDFSTCFFHSLPTEDDCISTDKDQHDAADSWLPGLAGASIVLPLQEAYWRDLLAGRLRETDVDTTALFISSENSPPQRVGLHVFHVERFSKTVGGPFASHALQHAVSTALSKGWNVVGCSGEYVAAPIRPAAARMGIMAHLYSHLRGYQTLTLALQLLGLSSDGDDPGCT